MLGHLPAEQQTQVLTLLLQQAQSGEEVNQQLETLLFLLSPNSGPAEEHQTAVFLKHLSERSLPSASADLVCLLETCLHIQSLA